MEPDELLERLREAPERAAIILDVDGVLAPIVDRPEDARVPDETRAALYPGMSLVNNWRVIFSTAFGAKDLPLLPDRTFYSDPDRIYDLEEIDVAGNFLHPRLPQSRAATSKVSGGADE